MLRWIFRWDVLALVIPGFSKMGLVAPLMFLSSGAACWLLGKNRTEDLRPGLRWVVVACASMVTIFPVLMLFEHLSDMALGIDYFLHLERLYTLGAANRRTLPVAYGLVLFSFALWLLRQRWMGQEATHSAAAGHEKRIGQRTVIVLACVAVAAGVGGFAVIEQSSAAV